MIVHTITSLTYVRTGNRAPNNLKFHPVVSIQEEHRRERKKRKVVRDRQLVGFLRVRHQRPIKAGRLPSEEAAGGRAVHGAEDRPAMGWREPVL